MIARSDFEKIDIRIGTILTADEFPTAKKPAYQLTINFGSKIGIKKSSAQITHHYELNELVNRQVIAVVNFPSKQISSFLSECLVLGIHDEHNKVVLLGADSEVENGSKIG